MPDQYALDYVRRHHIDTLTRPLFMEYGMVSSHAPWNHQAALLVDWDSIGDGSIFRRIEPVMFPTSWDNMDQPIAREAYLHSVLYVLEVLVRFIHSYVEGESLFVLVGDHQPVAEITGQSDSPGVIMHVLSTNQAVTDKFVERGFARGMRPKSPTPRLGLEAFLPPFMQDFSEPPE
jgi:hypothetical protein